LKGLPGEERMLVRAVDGLVPRMDGQVLEVGADGTAREAGGLVCKRVAASPAGGGLCLALSKNGTSYEGIVFDRRYEPRLRFPIVGVPDRARISRDGRLAGFTTFDEGSSQGYFASTSGFSVDTRIVDMRSGKTALRLSLDDLEVTRRGERFAPVDTEFWGVTFAAGTRFYATMAADFVHYLIEGDVRTRRAHVIASHVECPALSPDGTRIAYKRRIKYTNTWRFHVLDLRSGRDVALAETRSIDDQPEWWGDDRIVYSDDRRVFAAPADGSGEPERLAAAATSPTLLDR
jgi:hypothetical protein